MLSRWRQVRRDGGDAGITITELLVGMALVTVVGALTLTWMVGSTRANGRTTASGQVTANARNAVASWSSLLGVMAPPSAASPNARHLTVSATSISFDAQLDSKPSDCSGATCQDASSTPVTLQLADAQVSQTLTRADGAAKQVFVSTGARPSGTCLFALYTGAGDALPGCTGLTPAQLDTVARVDFEFTVAVPGAPSQVYGTGAALPGSLS